ncbi:tachylectin-related carbohydrate-binding protein [Micromonospora sp. HK10]|uniref:tachylectin-related carbohydrate-binding protein n=1 Tax=Micromonospora sp. HK10 TaxID=1538294 RepID=UPI003510AA48
MVPVRRDRPGWSIKGCTLDSGWGQYDMIVAAGPGVLHARTPAGPLYRHRTTPPASAGSTTIPTPYP